MKDYTHIHMHIGNSLPICALIEIPVLACKVHKPYIYVGEGTNKASLELVEIFIL